MLICRMDDRLRELLKKSQETNQESQGYVPSSVRPFCIVYSVGNCGTTAITPSCFEAHFVFLFVKHHARRSINRKEKQEETLSASIEAFA